MKNNIYTVIAITVLGFAAFSGCSKNEAIPVAASSQPGTPEFVRLPERLDKSLKKAVSVTKFIYAAQGGTIELRDTYRAAPDSHLVVIYVSLAFQPGDLPYDASLTITIDDVLFLTNVDLTFGPHGINFNRPVKLTVFGTGLDLNINTTRQLKLYCVENGVWTQMVGSGIYLDGTGTLGAQGRLPHFSQYAFGRVNG